MLIDTHAHMISEYYNDLEQLLNDLKKITIINCASNKRDNEEILFLCEKHTNVYGTTGIHPNEVNEWSLAVKNKIEKMILNNKIIAIGEIGLDCHYEGDYEKQKEIFIEQLELARKYQVPVVIHSRDAFVDTYNILKEYKDLKKVIHCFDYGIDEATKFIAINCVLGINGIVTYKNSKQAEIVKAVDLEFLLAETDSPFLTPEPLRGRRNDSGKIICVIEKIAQLKGLNVEVVTKQLYNNALAQFDLPLEKW